MTKLQVHFKLENALDENLMRRIGDAQAIYGIDWLRLDSSMTKLLVEYDATRLRPDEVTAALRHCGLAVERI